MDKTSGNILSPRSWINSSTKSPPFKRAQGVLDPKNNKKPLSTEDFFKTLLAYYKPNRGQSLLSTPRELSFLNSLIIKNMYYSRYNSDSKISEETQKNIALAIKEGQLLDGGHMNGGVALAIAKNLHKFTNEEAQQNIAKAIVKGIFGDPMSLKVALAITKMLLMVTDEKAQGIISEAINLHKFTGQKAQRNIALAIKLGKLNPRFAIPPAIQWILDNCTQEDIIGDRIPPRPR